MFSVIRNAAPSPSESPIDRADASRPSGRPCWTLTNKRYVYESTRPSIVWVDLWISTSPAGSPRLKLDLISKLAIEGGIAGSVATTGVRKDEVHGVSVTKAVAELEAAKPSAQD